MTEKELLKYVLDRTPALRLLLEKYGNMSLFDYAEKKYNQTFESPRKKEFLEYISSYAEKKYSPEIAILVKTSLEENYCVSTADHHGPLGHPFWFQSAILRGLVNPKNAIINLCTSHVSLGNSSYPRGFVVQSDTQKIPHLQLPFFPAKERMLPVFGHPAFTEKDVGNCLKQLEKHTRNGHISEEKYETIENWIDNHILGTDILEKKTYSEQITTINARLWSYIFRDTLPSFIPLDGEDFVSEILSHHLHTSSGLSQILTEEALQAEIEEYFDGISCCFEKATSRGTYLFWFLDESGNRHALWREGNTLVGNNRKINIEMNREVLIKQLSAKRVIPSGLLMYATLAGYYGIRCFGGYAQGTYLPQLLSAYAKIHGETLKQIPESILCEDMVFSFTKKGTISTALDLLSDTSLFSHDKLLSGAKNMSISDSIYTMLPEIARCLSY